MICRTVHFHGNEPVKNDQWNGMVQQRTVDSLFRKLFVSCDKQSRTGDLVLQIPYFVNGEIVNVGTWTLKRATTAEEKLILMEAKQLESVTSAYQLVDKVDSLEDRLSSAHVSINEPYQAVARAVRKETNTPTNRFAVPSYKFEVISNPKKVDTHAHSPIRSCVRYNFLFFFLVHKATKIQKTMFVCLFFTDSFQNSSEQSFCFTFWLFSPCFTVGAPTTKIHTAIVFKN